MKSLLAKYDLSIYLETCMCQKITIVLYDPDLDSRRIAGPTQHGLSGYCLGQTTRVGNISSASPHRVHDRFHGRLFRALTRNDRQMFVPHPTFYSRIRQDPEADTEKDDPGQCPDHQSLLITRKSYQSYRSTHLLSRSTPHSTYRPKMRWSHAGMCPDRCHIGS